MAALIKGQMCLVARAGGRPPQRALAHNSPASEHFLLFDCLCGWEGFYFLPHVSRSREIASAIVVTPFWIGSKLSMIASNN
jgi:hypothetical protein